MKTRCTTMVSVALLVAACGGSDANDASSSGDVSQGGSAVSTGPGGTHAEGGGGAEHTSAGAGGTGGTPVGAGGAGGMGGTAPTYPPEFLPPGTGRCTLTPSNEAPTFITCSHETTTVNGRTILWQRPMGEPPPEGWPAVLVFQGTGASPELTWAGGTELVFGGFEQIRMQALLLDNGFTVIAPKALTGAWASNIAGGVGYELSSDHALILELLSLFEGDAFGPVNTSRLYATGISSGGYMTSRMAVTYPGEFSALAIQSAAYATCGGPACITPDPLPFDHPPTLFLHGLLDAVVPSWTSLVYADQLSSQDIENDRITDAGAGHRWLAVAPEQITYWFQTH